MKMHKNSIYIYDDSVRIEKWRVMKEKRKITLKSL